MTENQTSDRFVTIDVFADLSGLDITPFQKKHVVYPFKDFLLQHETSAGNILLGRSAGPWSKQEIRELEERILKTIEDDQAVIQFFRILQRLANCWKIRSSVDAENPRIAVRMGEPRNPYSVDLARSLRRYKEWGKWIGSFLTSDIVRTEDHGTPTRIDSIAPVLISAVLYGGLWNGASLVALVRAVPELLSWTLANIDGLQIGLSLSWGGSQAKEFRCWQPDSLTALLLLKTSDQAVLQILKPDPEGSATVPSDDVVLQRITAEIEKYRQKNHLQSSGLCSLETLIASTRCIGHTQMPAVVARYASRQIISHSLSLEQIQRISGCDWLFGLPLKSRQTISLERRDEGKPVKSDPVPDWATVVSEAILVGDFADAHKRLRSLVEGQSFPALALRIADYAARAVQLRSIVNGKKSAERFTERLHLLSCRLHLVWSDADPVQLSDSKIEKGYKTMLEGRGKSPSAERVRRELIVAARGFHSYLRNCHRKGPLKNPDLLAPRRLLDRVDVDLLSSDEYREVLHQIALRWPGNAHRDRRSIAKMLMSLGFRSGLRREEARLLRTDDVCLLGGRNELLIRPSGDHTLKSESARRRMPVGITMPADELELLHAWHSQRVLELSSAGAGSLWGSKSDGFDVIPPSIFKELNCIIAGVTGTQFSEHPTHFHHCRHALCTFGLFRLLMPSGAGMPRYLNPTDAAWLSSGDTFRPEQIRRTTSVSRTDVFLMAQLLGHLSPSTTLRYFHFGGELLKIYLDRSPIMKPESGVSRLAADASNKEKTATEVALDLLKARVNLARKAHDEWAGWSKYKAVPNVAQARLMQAWNFLRVLEDPNSHVFDAAQFVGLPIGEAETIANNARHLRLIKSRNGNPRHRFVDFYPHPNDRSQVDRSLVPQGSNDPEDLKIVARFAPVIARLFSNNNSQRTLLRGLESYVQFVSLSASYPIFRDPTSHGDSANDFLTFLDKLEIPGKDVCCISFGTREWITKWRCVFEKFGKKPQFEMRKPPLEKASSSPASLRIEPSFNSDPPSCAGSGIFGFRFLLVMSYIVFTP